MYYSKCNPKTAGFSMPAILEQFFPEESLSKYFSGTMPAANIRETEASFVIELAAPSLQKSDFDIKIEQALLTVSANKIEGEAKQYKSQEFNFSSFKRSFRLGKNVDIERIEARYENGILSIELPKKEQAQEKTTRNINIA